MVLWAGLKSPAVTCSHTTASISCHTLFKLMLFNSDSNSAKICTCKNGLICNFSRKEIFKMITDQVIMFFLGELGSWEEISAQF